ncbi:hypothetical protein WME95_45540 [Sorangium sp. So ce327]|uniref:hypothetical protein n=1 Tax=Sorangium sp. So ce327 TaxID=3133301 RepID=UPI003F5E9FA1
MPVHARATIAKLPAVAGSSGLSGASAPLGAQPAETTRGAWIESDCTHGAPSQVRPASTAFAEVQVPSHPSKAANEVAGASGPPHGKLA